MPRVRGLCRRRHCGRTLRLRRRRRRGADGQRHPSTWVEAGLLRSFLTSTGHWLRQLINMCVNSARAICALGASWQQDCFLDSRGFLVQTLLGRVASDATAGRVRGCVTARLMEFVVRLRTDKNRRRGVAGRRVLSHSLERCARCTRTPAPRRSCS